MHGKILRLVKHAIIYGAGSLGTRVIGFLLIPVYTRFMTPSDYGILALCATTTSLLNIVSVAGIPSATFRSYLHVASTDEERGQVLATGLIALTSLGTAVFFILVVAREGLAGLILGDRGMAHFILLIAMSNLAQVILQFRNSVFRMSDQSARYSVWTVTAFTINVSLSIVLVVGFRQGALGAMTANTATLALMALVFLPWALRHLRGGFSRTILRDLVTFGVPLIPMGMAAWVMHLSDAYMLRVFREPAEVGLYNLGYRFGLGIFLITESLKLAYPKVVFSEGSTEEAPALFARVVTYYAVVVGFICLAVSLFAPQIILIADSRFHVAWTVIPLVVFSYWLNGAVPLLHMGLDLNKKTHLLAAAYVMGAAVNIGLNLLLIPPYGRMGAASATLVTYAFLTVPTYLLSRRYFPLVLEWSRLARVVLVLGLAGLGAVLASGMSLWAAVGLKLALLLSVFPALWMIGFFSNDEIARARDFLRARRG